MIPMKKWGVDHWSTLAYIETRIVDRQGIPGIAQMRCNEKLHPQFVHCDVSGKEYPTRLSDGSNHPEPHDDWSCLDDAEAAGIINNIGSGLNRIYRLTTFGMTVCNELRNHKASGGKFSNFKYEQHEVNAGTTK